MKGPRTGSAALAHMSTIWKSTWSRVTLGTLVSIFFVYLAVKDVPLGEVLRALARANYVFVLLGILGMVLQGLLRAVRWAQLFYPFQEGLHVRRMFGISTVAQMLNIAVPMRLGDLARIYLAGEMEKRSKAQTLATLGTEKIFDTLMLVVMILTVPLFVTLPAELERPREGFIGLSFVLFAVAIALIFLGDRLLGLLRTVPLPWFRNLLDTHGALALSTLGVFKRWDLHLQLQLLSLVVAVLGVMTNYLTLLALNLHLPLIVPVLLFPVLQIGGVVPSSPGKVGLFQYLCILTLSLFSVEPSIGLAYGILLYLVAYGTPMVLGILFLWWGGVSLKNLGAVAVEPETPA